MVREKTTGQLFIFHDEKFPRSNGVVSLMLTATFLIVAHN
jgi:hypothetical protein